jgi:hypothetical protein
MRAGENFFLRKFSIIPLTTFARFASSLRSWNDENEETLLKHTSCLHALIREWITLNMLIQNSSIILLQKFIDWASFIVLAANLLSTMMSVIPSRAYRCVNGMKSSMTWNKNDNKDMMSSEAGLLTQKFPSCTSDSIKAGPFQGIQKHVCAKETTKLL